MASSIGDMVVRILGDNSDFNKSIDGAQQNFKKFGESAAKIGKSLTTFVTLPILGIGAAALKSAADMEQQQAAFEVLLGSAEDAQKMLQDLTDLAAKTPFQLPQLADATKVMLSFGISAEDTLVNLQQLGDIALGDSEKLRSLTLAFSQIQSTGRLMGQDLLQLINAGFNPLQIISEKTGETMAELKKRMEDGGISAIEISEAFKIATSEGGRFFGGMETASETLTGKISTLKDNVGILSRSLVEDLLPIAKDVVDRMIELAQKFSNLTSEQKETIIKVAAVAAAMGPLASGISKAVKAVQALQVALAFLAANPIVAAVAGIAAVTAALVILGKKRREAQLEELSEEFNDVAKSSGIAVEEIEAIQDALRLGSMDGFTDAAEQVDLLSQNLGVSKETIIKIGLQSQFVTAEYKTQLTALQEQFAELKSMNELTDSFFAKEKGMAAAKARQAEYDRQALATAEAKRKEEERINKIAAEYRVSLEKEYGFKLKNLEVTTEIEKIELEREKVLKEAEAHYIRTGKAVDDINRYYDILIKNIRDAGAATEDLAEETQGFWDTTGGPVIQSAIEGFFNFRAASDAAYQRMIDGSTEAYEHQTKTDREWLAEFKANRNAEEAASKAAADARIADENRVYSERESLAKSTLSIVGDLIETRYENEKELAQGNEKELRRIAREEANVNKALALFDIGINTAVAVTKLLARPVLAVAAGIAGATQALLVASRPLPALATGGIVTPQPGGVPVTVAEAGQTEVVFPLDKLDSFLSKRIEQPASGGFGGGSQPIIIQLDHQQFIDAIIKTNENAMRDQTMNLNAMQMGA